MPGVLRRALAMAAALAFAGALATACRPEPVPTPTSSATATPSSTPSLEPSPEPTETNPPNAGFQLPARCEDLYSAEMLAELLATNPPLNDPGVTMNSTQIVEALELLASGIPTIRCSWGGPSEYGLATNVSTVGAAKTAALIETLRGAGFGCESVWDGTMCALETTTIDLDDNEVHLGESHFVRGDGWVSTAWIDFYPEGYLEDVVATLWG